MILVTGATGFVGRHVVAALAPTTRVRALVRDARGAAVLSGIDCELAKGDVTDLASLRAATRGCKAVVHLVAIIAGRPEDFERVIAVGTRNLVEASQEAGVRKIVYVSALGTGRRAYDVVPYYRAKADAERAVVDSRIAQVILRPSFVFGADGGALPRFLRIARLAPVTPVIGSGRQRVQPIWIDDVVRAVGLALPLAGATVELGGPDVVDWNDLWRRLKAALGAQRPTVHVPSWLVRPQAALLERLPNPPLTRDQLRMLELGDNVVEDRGESMRALGLEDAVPLHEQLLRAARSLA
ncbi:MAG: NAD-dependent epimerase/dehydratase family protein [Actinobacteria bacterium]|nr:NAD-dependent epimerase/dehydratase family protein [Actinomycetota bacterium]